MAVPLGRVPNLADRLFAEVGRIAPGSVLFAFGHLGDGNLHFSACQPTGGDGGAYRALGPAIVQAVNEICWSLGGTMSAEHGIGQLHKHEMRGQKSAAELGFMWRIKRSVDPRGILNPDQLLPQPTPA